MIKRITHRLKCLMAWLLFFSALSNSFALNPTPDPVTPNRTKTLAPCEIICPGDLTFTLGSGECVVVVAYDVQTTGDCLPSVVVQTSGLPSGSAFPIGTTQNCFSIDLPPLGLPDGDTICCFNVIVNEFPNPISAIICNDLVFFSLDEDCQQCIGAEAIMEGGPYGCYNNYLVELDKTVPFGNGPWVSACVGISDIGKTYQVRVTEPVFGNKCWGNVKIEDKLPPVLACHDISISCNADPNLNAEPAPAITGYQKTTYAGINDLIGASGSPTPDIHVYSFDYGYLPTGTAVLDVNCRIKLTGHTALSDLKFVVKAPDGTTTEIFTQGGCTGSEWPIDGLFDDEGVSTLNCSELNANGSAIQCLELGISNPTILAAFDGKDARGVWSVTISDNFAVDDGVIEIVGLEVLVNVPQKLPADNCNGPVNLTHVDTEITGDCNGVFKILQRKWTAADAYGNTSTCIQNINLLQQTLADVVQPPNYDGIDAPSFLCTDTAYPTPEWLESQGLQGEPWISGQSVSCNIASSYQDQVLPVCDGTYKIRREWSIIDWCKGEVITHNQIIKVIDEQGPSLACPQNLSVSTDVFTCCATVDLPDIIITDGCSRIKTTNVTVTLFDPISGQQTGVQTFDGSLTNFTGNNLSDPDTLAAFGFPNCLPLGTHTVEYYAEDDCGNPGSCSFQLTVHDYTPPVAVCGEKTVVAIGIDDPTDCFGPEGPNGNPAALGACTFGGISWVKAATFDNGSYDQCDHVKFTIRRTAPYSDCILGLNAINGNTPCNDASPDFPSEFERAISEQDSIKFYSCEVGTMQPVILRVYQVDSNGIIANSPNGMPLFNECIIQVEVTDKIKPVCTPPSNMVVSCEQFNPDLSQYGNALLVDNCCLDTTKIYAGQCGLTHTVNYSNFDTLCNKGTILRTFNAFDCYGNSSQCTQQVVVNYNQDYFVRFPDDVIVTNCNGTGIYGEPTFFGEDCELLAVSYEDQVFPVSPDACYKIERNWTVINWCTFNPTLQPTIVPNPNPNAIANHPSNLPGPIVSACGTQPPWNATVVKISPTDPAATDYCSLWSADANGYRYKQSIKIIDTQDPTFTNCPTGTNNFSDSTTNDPALWNNVFNPNLPAQDFTETDINLTINSSDECSGTNIDTEFLLFLDLDGDGTTESVINSMNLSGADTIRYNNLNTPGYLGGTPVTFDSRPVPTNQKWHFTFSRSSTPTHVTASVRWNTALSPNTFVMPALPQGTHKIKWIATDQCGNENVCEHVFTIEQSPTSGIETLESDGFALFQNEPNPFNQTTSIGFRLPSAADAKLSVFDAEGRLIFDKTDYFKEGYNTVQLEASQLRVPSVLYYKLESGSQVAWRKMVLVR